MISNEGGTLVLGDVRVNTLDINTAVVPVRAARTENIGGSHSGGHGTAPPASDVLTAIVIMPVSGWLEVSYSGQQSFNTITGSTPWLFQVAVDGVAIAESAAIGEVPGDSVASQGAVFVSAGRHTVTLQWGAHYSITLSRRSMFVKGFPATE